MGSEGFKKAFQKGSDSSLLDLIRRSKEPEPFHWPQLSKSDEDNLRLSGTAKRFASIQSF